jgi:hypothetical protein
MRGKRTLRHSFDRFLVLGATNCKRDVLLSKEDIEALLQGKYIGLFDNEYTTIIRLEKE